MHPPEHPPTSYDVHPAHAHDLAAAQIRHDLETTEYHRSGPRPGGDDTHAGHSVEMFRQKFWGTLLLSIPTVIWSPTFQQWFSFEAPGGSLASRWVPAIFRTLV